MRKLLLIAGAAIGIAILIVAVVIGYAYINLNSIIAANRARLLDRASTAIGRPLEAGAIKATLGWGVAIDVTDVKLADDPAFSQLPFVQADNLFLKVELLPLLHKDLRVTELVLSQPQIRLIRAVSGALNVSTLPKKGAASAGNQFEQGNESGPESEGLPRLATRAPEATTTANNLVVQTFTIKDGRIFYIDQQAGGTQVTVNAVNLMVAHFNLTQPFDVTLDLAAFSDKENLQISGTAGPIVRDGAIDAGRIPFSLNAKVGPVTLAQLKSIPQLAKVLPRALAISGNLALQGKVDGTLDAISFDASGDLGDNRVAFAPSFDKPAGTALKFDASGARTAGNLTVRRADVTLADLRANLTEIDIAKGRVRAHVDTNRFDLSQIGRMITRAQTYSPTGTAEVHTAVTVIDSKPALNGTVALANVGATMANGQTPPISDLSGTIRMAGNSASAGPLTLKIGSSNARLQASATSLQPLRANYQLSADKIVVAELAPSRKDAGDENLMQMAANGTLVNDGGALAGSTRLSAASGLLSNVPFTTLALDANYGGDRVTVNSLTFNAFSGSLGVAGMAIIGAAPAFNFNIDAQNIDMQAALEAQHSKAAETIRGSLTGNLHIAGQGKNLDQIKPTMRGAGRARMGNGKLIGVNIVGQALSKVDNVPGIGALVPASIVANHPELFKSPDTDIQDASLTFTVLGPRITSHDLVARSPDYSIFADGWFDLDKNLDLAAKILMSKSFSSELVAAKRNVGYLTNSDGAVEIPLRVSGHLPHPTVAPDLTIIAQRAATHAVQGRVGELIQKNGIGELLKKKGLGGLLGGFGGGNNN